VGEGDVAGADFNRQGEHSVLFAGKIYRRGGGFEVRRYCDRRRNSGVENGYRDKGNFKQGF